MSRTIELPLRAPELFGKQGPWVVDDISFPKTKDQGRYEGVAEIAPKLGTHPDLKGVTHVLSTQRVGLPVNSTYRLTLKSVGPDNTTSTKIVAQDVLAAHPRAAITAGIYRMNNPEQANSDSAQDYSPTPDLVHWEQTRPKPRKYAATGRVDYIKNNAPHPDSDSTRSVEINLSNQEKKVELPEEPQLQYLDPNNTGFIAPERTGKIGPWRAIGKVKLSKERGKADDYGFIEVTNPKSTDPAKKYELSTYRIGEPGKFRYLIMLTPKTPEYALIEDTNAKFEAALLHEETDILVREAWFAHPSTALDRGVHLLNNPELRQEPYVDPANIEEMGGGVRANKKAWEGNRPLGYEAKSRRPDNESGVAPTSIGGYAGNIGITKESISKSPAPATPALESIPVESRGDVEKKLSEIATGLSKEGLDEDFTELPSTPNVGETTIVGKLRVRTKGEFLVFEPKVLAGNN